MSVTQLRPIQQVSPDQLAPIPTSLAELSVENLVLTLVATGVIPAKPAMAALARHSDTGRHLFDILQSSQWVNPHALYNQIADYWSVGQADLRRAPPDARLLARLGPLDCLRDGVIAWRQVGDATVIATAYPDRFAQHLPRLQREFGKVLMAVAPFQAIQAAILAICGPALAHRSENRVAAAESCRSLRAKTLQRPAIALGLAGACLFALSPMVAICALYAIALISMFAFSLLKLSVLFTRARPRKGSENPPIVARLPKVSIMVALYREADIAARLATRLGKLDYPRELLEILLVVEAEDQMTRRALAHSDLPGWMRVVVVPDGTVKTKPRALNYALDHCSGAIVGIYDAEDMPEPDQIRKVVQRFHEVGPEVVCLQGLLDFYNPHTNWLARCFTMEYASWFRAFLPGIERLGLAVPLGGTTLFFRRKVLDELGAWDAQNVTEDADLGLRLARHGYRTELIDTVTFEEANCRALPWVKQRSRWNKGYMMTWISHMRDPVALWRQLGPRRFLGFQTLFLGAILQGLLAPLLWTFWVIPFGLWHPVSAVLPHTGFVALYLSMFAVQALTIGFDIIGLRRTAHQMNLLWVPTLAVYHMMATLSAYKALWELLTKPFYWDKTSHGHFDT